MPKKSKTQRPNKLIFGIKLKHIVIVLAVLVAVALVSPLIKTQYEKWENRNRGNESLSSLYGLEESLPLPEDFRRRSEEHGCYADLLGAEQCNHSIQFLESTDDPGFTRLIDQIQEDGWAFKNAEDSDSYSRAVAVYDGETVCISIQEPKNAYEPQKGGHVFLSGNDFGSCDHLAELLP